MCNSSKEHETNQLSQMNMAKNICLVGLTLIVLKTTTDLVLEVYGSSIILVKKKQNNAQLVS